MTLLLFGIIMVLTVSRNSFEARKSAYTAEDKSLVLAKPNQ